MGPSDWEGGISVPGCPRVATAGRGVPGARAGFVGNLFWE